MDITLEDLDTNEYDWNCEALNGFKNLDSAIENAINYITGLEKNKIF